MAQRASIRRGAPEGLREVSGVLRRSVKSALARWVLHKRRATTSVAPRDEATHTWDGRRRFAEDYTFCGAQSELGVVIRLEWLPGRGCHRVWVTLFRGQEVYCLEGGQLVVRGHEHDRWRAAGLRIDCSTPLKSWTVRFSGRVRQGRPPHRRDAPELRCSLDLTFVAEGAPYCPGRDDDPELVARHLGAASWDAKLVRSVRRGTNRGYVQTGALHGTLALGEELIPVRAACIRQHMWGVRDWGASDLAFQCFAAFNDGRRVWVHHARFPVVTLEGGFVATDGEVCPVRSVGLSAESRPGRAPGHATLTLDHARDVLDVEAQMWSDIAVTVDGRGEVQLGLCRLSGGDGWGIWGGQRRVLPRSR